MSEARGQKYRAAARVGRPERVSRRAPENDPDPAEALTSVPARRTPGPRCSDGAGSNGTGSNGNGSHGNGVASGAGTGRRAKRDADTATLAAERAPERTAEKTAAPETPAREPERVESTEGLGIADLLAGALAAYRGI
jgi:hypothetical protein